MKAPASDALTLHLLEAARSILRPPRGFLKKPYLAPGGTYLEQLWDWDSFWVAKALLSPGNPSDERTRALILEHAEGSWLNLFANQGNNGTVPILILPEKRDFFGCTEDPTLRKNQAKPVLAQFAVEIGKARGSHEWVRPHFDRLIRFLKSWRDHYRSSCGLLAWGSDVAIGIDNDPTTYGRPEFSSANLLLNCFYYRDLLAASEIAGQLGDPRQSDTLEAEAREIGEAIRAECWDPVDGFFYSVDVQSADRREEHIPVEVPRGMAMAWKTLPLKIKLFTGFLPMWCGLATPKEADLLVGHLRNPREFAAPWGVPALAKNERMYAPEAESANPSNWLGPIWIVANYMVWEGLRRYGYHGDAAQLAEKTITLLEQDLHRTGTLHEYYHPDTGAPNRNAGFLSWNLLALDLIAGAAD